MFKHQSFYIAAILLLASCSSRGSVSGVEGTHASSLPKELFSERWVMPAEQLKKTYPDQSLQLDVEYETFLSFEPNKITKTTVCHFKSPVQKTLIVDTASPILMGPKNIRVLLSSAQKQDYNVTLAPKNGKGPNIKRSFYCTSSLEPKTYSYELKEDELILKPVEETLKLKKYKQN